MPLTSSLFAAAHNWLRQTFFATQKTFGCFLTSDTKVAIEYMRGGCKTYTNLINNQTLLSIKTAEKYEGKTSEHKLRQDFINMIKSQTKRYSAAVIFCFQLL